MSEPPRFRAPYGTEDVLPERIPIWRRVEGTMREVCARFGYEELRTPVLEHTSLFHKATGETTDIVEKEMYTFGAGEDAISLRPEMTPAVVRVLVEHNLHKQQGFWKFFYLGPAFRHERPQKGRYRQFHQFGVEAIGSADPLVDVETMLLYTEVLRELGVKDTEARVNTLGCAKCRSGYRDVLRAEIAKDLAGRCDNCRRRFERNVFRILDCKSEGCVKRNAGLPPVLEHVCAECRTHFSAVETGLRGAGVSFQVDPRIVRGLDYYTRTVYEFRSPLLGAQDAICGGGRYDTLVRDMGGPDLGSVGFASGIERLLLVMEASGLKCAAAPADFYVVAVGDESRSEAFRLATELRRAGLRGDLDFERRSVKAQMRSANKGGARWALLLGKNEIDGGRVRVKNMESGEERDAVRTDVSALLKGGTP